MKLGNLSSLDWSLYALPIILVFVGVATIYSTTLGTNRFYLTYNQLIFLGLGVVLMFLVTFYDYRNLLGLTRPIYITTVLLLVLVAVLGKEKLGATRWIDLGFFQLQPSELAKAGVLFLSSALLTAHSKNWARTIIWLVSLTVLPLVFIITQPDLGTAIIITIIVLSLFFSCAVGRKIKIVFILILIALAPLSWMSMREYQRERLRTFVDPERDPRGSGYNVIQSMIAVGSGGIYGRGLGNGPQSQLNFLPVSHTDFIFAGWSEATGFIGSLALIALEMLLAWRVYRVLSVAKDTFGQYLAIGFGSMVLSQTAINIGMNIGLAPVTGIPLPFVSYGGTSLLVSFIMIGLMQSIYLRYRRSTIS